jgi:hypothetical protein
VKWSCDEDLRWLLTEAHTSLNSSQDFVNAFCVCSGVSVTLNVATFRSLSILLTTAEPKRGQSQRDESLGIHELTWFSGHFYIRISSIFWFWYIYWS